MFGTLSPGGVYLEVKGAFINPSGSGDSQIVAAAGAGKIIRVISAVVVATLANAVHFRSATNPISATWPLAANGGLVLPLLEDGWFQTNANEALNINMGTATATGVQVCYVVF